MDLALVTGRGEPLLTQWPGCTDPLVSDQATIQIGDRDAGTDEDFLPSTISRIDIHEALALGASEVVRRALDHFNRQLLNRVWVHIDLDVLDEGVMPAVDSPGSPGFDFEYLADLIRGLMSDRAVIGLNLTIYDPEKDPTGMHASRIAQAISTAMKQAQRVRAG